MGGARLVRGHLAARADPGDATVAHRDRAILDRAIGRATRDHGREAQVGP